MFKAWGICLMLLFAMGKEAIAQNYTEEETQAFILEVMSSYKNPMAYFPLRRDMFLPSQAEIDSLDRVLDGFSSPHLSYQYLFLSKSDTLKREIFLDTRGVPLFKSSNRKPISTGSDLNYFKRRQDKLLNASPGLGKFLLYNEQFKKLYQLQKH